MEKYAHRRNDISELIKAHYNIVKTRPSMQLQWAPLMRYWYKGAIIANL